VSNVVEIEKYRQRKPKHWDMFQGPALTKMLLDNAARGCSPPMVMGMYEGYDLIAKNILGLPPETL